MNEIRNLGMNEIRTTYAGSLKSSEIRGAGELGSAHIVVTEAEHHFNYGIEVLTPFPIF